MYMAEKQMLRPHISERCDLNFDHLFVPHPIVVGEAVGKGRLFSILITCPAKYFGQVDDQGRMNYHLERLSNLRVAWIFVSA